jgi:hypothetical protein
MLKRPKARRCTLKPTIWFSACMAENLGFSRATACNSPLRTYFVQHATTNRVQQRTPAVLCERGLSWTFPLIRRSRRSPRRASQAENAGSIPVARSLRSPNFVCCSGSCTTPWLRYLHDTFRTPAPVARRHLAIRLDGPRHPFTVRERTHKGERRVALLEHHQSPTEVPVRNRLAVMTTNVVDSPGPPMR